MKDTFPVRATRRLLEELGLAQLFALGNGLVAKTTGTTYAARTIQQPAAGITVTNGDGVAGDPTLALNGDLAGVEGLNSTGLAARTATSTWATRALQAPAAGIAITNNDGVAGNPTFSLVNDLAGLEALNNTGNVFRTGDGTFAQYTPAVADLAAGAPAGHSIIVTLTLVDPFGTAVPRTQRFRAILLDGNGLQTVVGSWTIAIGGGASAVSANTQPSVLFDTSNAGAAQLTVHDVGGAFVGTVFLLLQPLGTQPGGVRNVGYPSMIPLTF